MITQSSLDLLKSRIDVVDTVGSYLELKKAGANYKAPCPFHDEKSASFTVSPQKQIYHCFGCGASGDAIKFVQKYKKLTFAEAVEDIANDLNFTLSYDSANETRKDYTAIMENTNRFYLSSMTSDITDYLHTRGVSDESIATFEIGYAPSSHVQLSHLKAGAFNTTDAIECGVCAVDEGRTYARLTDRISFPIRTHTGKLIGFGGRILSGDRAKYINSPQTVLFDKSRNLYGYNIAKPTIHDRGTITITEGYFDVVMFHQAGIRTAVATMGTALTEEHAKLIKKNHWRTLLCYDGDRAGIAAAFKAAKLLSSHGIFGGVVIFPEGKDPADMVRDGDIDGLHLLLKRPRPLIRFVIEHIAASYNLALPQDKESALREINAFTATLSPLIQDEYRSIIAGILSIDPRHVTTAPITKAPVAKLPDINVSELNIIKTARENPLAFAYFIDNVERDCFVTHTLEYDMLMSGDSTIDGILLRDELSIYGEHEFMQQVKILQLHAYQKQFKEILDSGGNFETKSEKIKEIGDKMYKIQLQLNTRGAA